MDEKWRTVIRYVLLPALIIWVICAAAIVWNSYYPVSIDPLDPPPPDYQGPATPDRA